MPLPVILNVGSVLSALFWPHAATGGAAAAAGASAAKDAGAAGAAASSSVAAATSAKAASVDGAVRGGVLGTAEAGKDATDVWTATKVAAVVVGTLGTARLTSKAKEAKKGAEEKGED